MEEGSQVFELKASVLIPKAPNFLRLTNGGTIRLGDIPDDALQGLAEQWKISLLEKAASQRQQPEKE